MEEASGLWLWLEKGAWPLSRRPLSCTCGVHVCDLSPGRAVGSLSEVLTAWSCLGAVSPLCRGPRAALAGEPCWLAVQRAPLVREGAYHVWPGEGPEGLV